jgi:hypothetical protein
MDRWHRSAAGTAALGHAHIRRPRRRWLLLVVASTVGMVGCSSPSAADVNRVARSVPTPSGLTFAGVSDVDHPRLVGAASHEAEAKYTNPPMPCSQLRAEWVATLDAAHWSIDNGKSTFSQIFITHGGYRIIVSLDGIASCADSSVGVDG